MTGPEYPKRLSTAALPVLMPPIVHRWTQIHDEAEALPKVNPPADVVRSIAARGCNNYLDDFSTMFNLMRGPLEALAEIEQLVANCEEALRNETVPHRLTVEDLVAQLRRAL